MKKLIYLLLLPLVVAVTEGAEGVAIGLTTADASLDAQLLFPFTPTQRACCWNVYCQP